MRMNNNRRKLFSPLSPLGTLADRAIYFACVNLFFNLSQIISGSTESIFTIFLSNERFLHAFSRCGPLFSDSLRDVAMETDFWENLRNDLYSTRWHFATDLNIVIPIYS